MDLVEKTVQDQVVAYNNHDVEAFAALYSPDIAIFDLPTGKAMTHGTSELKALYADLYQQNPRIHVDVARRSVLGRFVVDEEQVTGLPDGGQMRAIAIYEVIDGLITRVWFVRG